MVSSVACLHKQSQSLLTIVVCQYSLCSLVKLRSGLWTCTFFGTFPTHIIVWKNLFIPHTLIPYPCLWRPSPIEYLLPPFCPLVHTGHVPRWHLSKVRLLLKLMRRVVAARRLGFNQTQYSWMGKDHILEQCRIQYIRKCMNLNEM